VEQAMDRILQTSWERTGPWVLYDGECALCRAGAARFAALLHRRGFRLAPLQSPVGRHFAPGQLSEMKLVTRDLRILGGAAAIAAIARTIWWAKPLAWLWNVRLLRPALKHAYRWIARHRSCTDGCPGHIAR
jgi:predicted DCC family thiol-disulfide oxidoreductase YuxK